MTTYYAKASWPGRADLLTADIQQLWTSLEEEKLVKIIFYDGLINSYKDFQHWVLKETNYFAGLYKTGDPEPVGLFWLNGQAGRTAMIHFGLFKSGRPEGLDIGRAVLGWCFKGGLRALYGLTPGLYAGAADYIKCLGFQIIGRLPEACPMFRKGEIIYREGLISVIKAGDFYQLNK